VYSTPEELVANGDDDEASAWLWLHDTYPTAIFLPFTSITSASDLTPYRVLFWLRDLEGVGEADVWNIPATVESATPAIREWYKNGGSLLLWSHATVYAGHLGRLNLDDMKGNDHAFGFGVGGINNDVWKMAVQLNPGSRFSKDHSTHPIYKGMEVESTDRTKLIAFKGPGWTEDHNCLYFNLPSLLTGIGQPGGSLLHAADPDLRHLSAGHLGQPDRLGEPDECLGGPAGQHRVPGHAAVHRQRRLRILHEEPGRNA
jgi:hypothetical protein